MSTSERHSINFFIIFAAVAAVGLVSVFIFLLNQKSQLTNTLPSNTLPTRDGATIVQVAPPQLLTATVSGQLEQLEKYLTVESALLGARDNMSLYFKDYNQTKEISLDPSRSWIPASTIKAYVVLEAYRQRRLGLINFDQLITITGNNVVPTELETDDLPRLREGTVATIQQLIEAMVTQSDNTAYNTLLDILDRRNITSTLRDIGITETVVGEKLNLDDTQYQNDLTVSGRQANTTTVKDLAVFFDFLYNHKVPEADEILGIFKRQKINTMIPALLPPNTTVAHKTGDWAPIYNDGGIVYKPNEPFLLTIFTNSNDTKVLSQMARVAYFRDPATVGAAPDTKYTPQQTSEWQTDRIYLTEVPQPTSVLGETNQKFPQVTAEDLGITAKDLAIDAGDIVKINPATVTPHSPGYLFKRVIEILQTLGPQNKTHLVNNRLSMSQARLSEIKTLVKQGDLVTTEQLLTESERQLQTSVAVAQSNNLLDAKIPEIKRTNDLHYAVLAAAATEIPSDKKADFIDMVYRFEQKNQQEVKPIIKDSLIANPLKQQPIIGTVKEVTNNQITLSFDTAPDKQMAINTLTPTRDFQSQILETTPSAFAPGSKIAVIGQTDNEGVIIPNFILKNVPHELPDKHEGVVIEINPNKQTMQIQTPDGTREDIQVNSDTILKGRDTEVSLTGIKAGSSITVFGEIQNSASNSTGLTASTSQSDKEQKVPSASAQLRPNASTPNVIQVPPPGAPVGKTLQPTPTTSVSKPNTSATNTQSPPPATIKATSVTVTKNSSGKDEVIEKSKNTSPTEVKKSDSGKSTPPPPAKSNAPLPPPPPPPATKK